MRKLPLLLAAAAMAYMPAAYAAGKYNFQKVDGVVELFTSQGCSSCPPADAYMGEVKRGNKNKLALTYAVTIWDYLGWKDKFVNLCGSFEQIIHMTLQNHANTASGKTNNVELSTQAMQAFYFHVLALYKGGYIKSAKQQEALLAQLITTWCAN